jgi:hypothetical protein
LNPQILSFVTYFKKALMYNESMDSITIHGEKYISSKRAAEILNYTQDYIGQLCRGGKIPAERVGGMWYVLESATSGENTDSESQGVEDTEGIIFDGEAYVSSKEASQITGYAKDYIGQLCRSSKLKCRQVGRGWYISKLSISREKGLEEGVSPKEEGNIVSVTQFQPVTSPVTSVVPLSAYSIDTRPLFPALIKPIPAQPSLLYEILRDEPQITQTEEKKEPQIIITKQKYEVVRVPERRLRRRSPLSLLIPRVALVSALGLSIFFVSSLSQTLTFEQIINYPTVISGDFVDTFLSNRDISNNLASLTQARETVSFFGHILTKITDFLSTTFEYQAQ